jgi:hypothetical protein
MIPAEKVSSSSLVTTRGTRVSRNRQVRSERGAALLAALCFAAVLTISLGSYMTLCYRELALSSRTVQGTRSIELAEMGMEDALWALNKNDWSTWTISGTTATKTISGLSFDGGVTGSISLRVTSYNGTAGTRTVNVTGTTTNPSGETVSRTLTSTSAKAPLFLNAIAATNGTVTFASGGTVDSYDSSLGAYTAQTPGYSAVVASQAASSSSATVQLTNAQIKGYAASLYSGGPSYSTSAKIVGPSTPTTTRIDTSRISSSPHQPVFTIKTITGSGTTLANPSAGSTTTIGSPADTTPAIYYSSGLDLRSTTKIIVNGPVRLVVSGSFYVGLNGGTPSIEVNNSGTLEVFAAADIAIYGNGINNSSKDPQRVIVYSNNTLTAPDMNTTVPFYGVIYTPNGTFNVLGNSTVYGAIVAKKVAFTGSAPVVHYDLNLRQAVFDGVETPYAISDWREPTAD